MSRNTFPSVDWSKDIKVACERLLHPTVDEAGERERQCRLLAVLLAGPALAALAAMQLGVQFFGGAAALVLAAMVFGIGLLAPFALMASARRNVIQPASLVIAATATGVLIAAAGGPASPLAMMSIALVWEAGWVGRTGRSLVWGILAACMAVALGAALRELIVPAAEPTAWQWLVPCIYAVALAVRLPAMSFGEDPTREPAKPAFEEIIGAAVFHLQAEGDVTETSAKAEELLGVAPEMLLGTGLFERLHVADRVAWLSALADLKDGAEARTLRLRVRVPVKAAADAGSAYRAYVCDVYSRPGEEGCIAMLREDARVAELEDELAKAREWAEGATLARDKILASVSHELRTPLNAIVGFSDVLVNEMFGGFANERQREYVRLIHQAGGHLLSVVNAVLDVSKLQSGTYQPQAEIFSFEEAAHLCMAMTTHQAEAKAIELTMDIADDVGDINCDRRVLQQVLINLLSNAVKFTPSGEVKVTARRCDDRLDFTVSDTGIGISAEDLKRLGKPFVQLQSDYSGEGIGLGLALVKGLVRLQGGGMSIESAPGAGTRVHVSLPVGGFRRQGQGEEANAAMTGANWNGEWNHDAERKTA